MGPTRYIRQYTPHQAHKLSTVLTALSLSLSLSPPWRTCARDLEANRRRRRGAPRRSSDIWRRRSDDVETVPSKANDGTLEDLAKLVNKDWPIVPAAGAAAVTFVENPYSQPWVFQALPSSNVTINLNEESCGPSFSDSVSTVMASVDLGGGLYGISKEVLGLESEKWLMEEVEEASGLYGLTKEVIGLESLKLVMAEEKEASGFGCASGETKELARGGWAGVEMDWDDAALARFIGEDGDLPEGCVE